jgi:hypothetical protein
MRNPVVQSSIATSLALLSPAALADTQEELQAMLSKVVIYGLMALAIVVAILVYFMRSRDKRQFEHGDRFTPSHPIPQSLSVCG